MSHQLSILEWLQLAFEEPVDQINECYYFDRRDNEFFSIFITDYFLLGPDKSIVESPYSASEMLLLEDRMSRIESKDSSILYIPRLTVDERRDLVLSFLDNVNNDDSLLRNEIDKEDGRNLFKFFKGRLPDHLKGEWYGFKMETIRPKVESFCNLENINLDTATLWTDLKVTKVELYSGLESKQDQYPSRKKRWWKFW